MLVLGISDGHDAGACLVDDGRLLAAVSEERFTRCKRQAGFPRESIRWCLTATGVRPADVRRVAVAERNGRGLHRLFDPWYRRTDPNRPMNRLANRWSMTLQNTVTAWPTLAWTDRELARRILRRRLSYLDLHAPVTLVDHHRAHAVSAAVGSAFPEALVVTMDAFGDGASGTVGEWRDGEWTLRHRTPFPHSASLLYGLTTAFLGFREGEEGQVAGLAAGGKSEATVAAFRRCLTLVDRDLRLLRLPTPADLNRWLPGQDLRDIAAGLQQCVQDVVVRFIVPWAERLGARRLCLAGGLFANVRLNQEIAESYAWDDVFVFPHMGDGGLCVGAAWEQSDRRYAQPLDPFLGPEAGLLSADNSGDDDLERLPLDRARLTRLADILAAGGVVGCAAGRLEFGPRALGNRSLLFSARTPEPAARLGDALKRPRSMPYAPVIRDEDLSRFTAAPRWRGYDYMTITATALPDIAALHPVAVHVDGSMRLQTATRSARPWLHELLTAYAAHCDPPLLINTSFNRHSEPIIREATRARELFRQIPLDALVTDSGVLVRRK